MSHISAFMAITAGSKTPPDVKSGDVWITGQKNAQAGYWVHYGVSDGWTCPICGLAVARDEITCPLGSDGVRNVAY